MPAGCADRREADSWSRTASQIPNTGESRQLGGLDISDGYDPAGNRTLCVDATTSTAYTYNNANWLGGEMLSQYFWLDADIGGALPAGDSGVNMAAGVWTVQGGGSGLASLADQFHLSHQSAPRALRWR